MPVAKTIAEQLQRASWIRRMFEEGARLKRERGAANVFDFTLGNPEVEPPEAVLATLRRLIAAPRPDSKDQRFSGFQGSLYGEVRRTGVDTRKIASGESVCWDRPVAA